MKRGYTHDYFEFEEQTATTSARVIVPIVLEYILPQSVVDVGCGVGAWLAEFVANNATDIYGLDGDWIDPSQLLISHDRFQKADLSQPVKLERTFDLALSLEVAEHLPERAASTFVATLAGLAPVVLFSAAIPHQGGQNHVNEQWPEYWAGKFERHGLVPVDAIRRRIWENRDVAWWYAQNIVFYVREDRLPEFPRLVAERDHHRSPLALVHPRNYSRYTSQNPNHLDWLREQCREVFSRIRR